MWIYVRIQTAFEAATFSRRLMQKKTPQLILISYIDLSLLEFIA